MHKGNHIVISALLISIVFTELTMSFRSQAGDMTDSLTCLSSAWQPMPTFEPVLEAVLQHHEELLQWWEVRVQGPAQAQG